jgi:hypothetical protein
MGERSSAVLTWTMPFILAGASLAAGWESMRLAPGEVPGAKSEFSTPLLDLVVFGLAVMACIACYVWDRSALLTAATTIGALWYYSELYLHASTDPLAGTVYLVTLPLAVACAICGIAGFVFGIQRRRREVGYRPHRTIGNHPDPP